ncbi:AAA domain-containing protein [Fastidiosibacter lacustris]|uniref:AAA domain-containing protein n=1 Tax=Fastidiosibacter lacustris TaxID=2056695 RepID=UPI000E344DDF|nr:AAA domain-containing protein [Fastidiosibacter lacustris]
MVDFLPTVKRVKQKSIERLVKENGYAFGVFDDFTSLTKLKEFVDDKVNQLSTAWQNYLTALQVLGVAKELASKFIVEIDELADTKIRFKIFLLTSHYWEGRWLQDMEAYLKRQKLYGITKDDEKSKTQIMEDWRRRMKLTPCAVSTCFMLPTFLRGKEHNNSGQDAPNLYLYNMIDLLIVDEAGQVLPEVAGAAFTLAKKALVIGDTRQLEPIWSTSAHIDIGNLIESGVIQKGENSDEKYRELQELGISSAMGSAMMIAQHASKYHYSSGMERGMYLYEHRRCYNEIIEYCNDLCYDWKLAALRGNAPEDNLSGLRYLHIDGRCEQDSGGSRYNLLEAETIAAWINDNQELIKERYPTKYQEGGLGAVLAVITPFSVQVAALKQACTRYEIKVKEEGKNEKSHGIIVDTIHSLQGAEKEIVIFSSVYSKHADGKFIDESPSMLNVAVSRAKDGFFVFGDMDLFNPDTFTPRGKLAHYLFRHAHQQIYFSKLKGLVRSDLRTSQTNPYLIENAKEHDDFLLKTLCQAKFEVHIFSPWMQLRKIQAINAYAIMIECVKRGVKINIYTDPNNISNEYQQRFLKDKAHLESLGIGVKCIRRMHSKLLICDDMIYCVGSFNWFSAAREPHYQNLEHSLVYTGSKLKNEIVLLKQELENRIVNIKIPEELV